MPVTAWPAVNEMVFGLDPSSLLYQRTGWALVGSTNSNHAEPDGIPDNVYCPDAFVRVAERTPPLIPTTHTPATGPLTSETVPEIDAGFTGTENPDASNDVLTDTGPDPVATVTRSPAPNANADVLLLKYSARPTPDGSMNNK